MKLDYGYQQNEWIAIYVDCHGVQHGKQFDHFAEAVNFVNHCYCKVGVITTSMFNTIATNDSVIIDED